MLLATGTDSSEIKLFNYPCIDPATKFDVYYGHCSHVTKAKFSADDDFLISTGGADMTVLVWDTDVINLNSKQVTEYHPDDLENEVKQD
jgi:WD40 repeat protein